MASGDEIEMFGDSLKGSSPGPLEDSSPSAEQDHVCNLCSNKYSSPRVLSCLHVYCEACLDKLLIDEAGDTGKRGSIITCPDCEQETKIGTKGAASLPCDYVLSNILDMSAIETMAVLCTSCKTKEKAVARCSDCANFLCPNCNTAHQFMRCFENHHVVAFEELKKSGEAIPIHKPILCVIHPNENMKYYCYTCQVPICNDCMAADHKSPDHQYERIGDAEARQREELHSLMSESKSKVAFCEEASTHLENALSELQLQHDNAKDLIHETFQSYKAVLEKCRDKVLDDLEKLHSERELKIMDTFHSVEKTMEKIEDACKFTSRLLEHGNTVEILSLKRFVGAQLLYLINNTPKPDVNVSLEFETDIEKFEDAVKVSFGSFKADATSTPKETSPPPTLSDHAPPPTPSPASLPTSMQSSFEGEAFVLPPGVLTPDGPPPPTPVSSLSPNAVLQLTSIQEYNLQQLATLAEKEERERAAQAQVPVAGPVAVNSSTPVPPTPSSSNPSPTSTFSLVELFSGDPASTSHINAINNLQALAKLGSVSLNNQGQVVLNGQVVPGVTLDNLPGPGSVPSPTPTPPPPQTPLPHTLGALLNDFATNPLNGAPPNNNIGIGRGPSPSMDSGTSPLLPNTHQTMALNGGGFQAISSSNSAIMPQTGLNSTGPHGAFPQPRSASTKLTPMQIRCKFGQLGPSKGQFNSPHGFCLGTEEDIIVADTNNHRIQVFEKTGTFKFQFGIPGKEEGQLWYPRKVAVMRSTGKFVVCDRGNERSRMQIFTKNGHFIKKIAIRYIDIVAGLAVTTQSHIVAVDSVSPTVFVIAETGDLLRWFDCSDYMREPSDIAISGKEYFVCDFKGHCVVVFNEEGQFLRRIGCENITNFPNGIDISDAGDVLVGDSHGNRFHVAVFTRDGSLLSEFECPYVKVSRCCGLKITSEGYVVTLAKNNHHVLVLNTLYIV